MAGEKTGAEFKFCFPHCAVNGGVNLEGSQPQRLSSERHMKLKDLSYSQVLEREAWNSLRAMQKPPKFGHGRQGESGARTCGLAPLLRVMGAGTRGTWEACSLGNQCNWVNVERRKVGKS